MDRLIIKGGPALNGTIAVSGAKNAALPILAATLLTKEPMLIRNAPHLRDVTTTMELLGYMGSKLTLDERMCIEVDNRNIKELFVPYELVRTMRASVLVLGPLLSHYGKADVSLPGGCAIGSRPINLHLEGLSAMGADISVSGGYVHAVANRLKGAPIVMDMVTVTGTENLMMAATLAEGTTVIENAACEPEVTNLANCLITMGAKITGAGTSRIVIEGVEQLHGGCFDVLPDRIEAGTYLIATAMTGGQITLKNACPNMLAAVLEKLTEAGAEITVNDNSITLCMHDRRPQATDICTAPFPGFPTDMQAQFTAMNCIARGQSTITETVFENRFMHVQELRRMGADLTLVGNKVVSNGIDQLTAAPVMATDLRASASLVLAGLAAKGETVVDRIYHIDRGYETIEEKLSLLGAHIKRVPI